MKKLIVVICVFLVVGCASYKPALTVKQKNDISSLRVISVIDQDEIKVQFNVSTGGAAVGGLVGAIIDTSVNNSLAKKAERMADPLRDAMIDFDVNEQLHNAYQRTTGNVAWASTTSFETRGAITPKDIREIVTTMEEDALLIITSQYSLSPRQAIFEIDSQIDLYVKKETSNNALRSKRVATSLLRFQSDLVSPELQSLNKALEKIEKEYHGKVEAAKSVADHQEAKSWRKNEIKIAKKQVDEKLQAERDALLKEKISSVRKEYDPKIAEARWDGKEQLKRDKNRAIAGVKKEMAEYDIKKRNALWVENDGNLLKSEMNIGIKNMGYLMSVVLNRDITEEEFKRGITKVATGNPDVNVTRTFGQINAYLVGDSEDNSRSYYVIKKAPGGLVFADYYSLIKGHKIFPKAVRN